MSSLVTLEDLIEWIEADDDYVSLGQLEGEVIDSGGNLDPPTIAAVCDEIERGLREGKIRIGQVGGATFYPYDESNLALLARIGDALAQDACDPDYHDIWFDIARPD